MAAQATKLYIVAETNDSRFLHMNNIFHFCQKQALDIRRSTMRNGEAQVGNSSTMK